MEYIEELKNPIWESLNGPHSHFAIGTDNAKCYQRDISSWAGLTHNSDDDLRELAKIIDVDQMVIIIGKLEQHTEEWITLISIEVVQMLCPERISIPEHDAKIITLTPDDVPDILELVKLTEPGPFEKHTIEMGPYFGIRDNGQLIAMAGSRFFTGHYREVSAVCTHPDYRGRGYAALLISILVNKYFDEGIIPILHAAPDNMNAIRLYEKLGFVHNHRPGLLAVKRAGNKKATPD